MKKILTVALVAAAAFAAEGFKVISKIKIGGDGQLGLCRHGQRQPAGFTPRTARRGSGGPRRRQGGRARFRICTACTASRSRTELGKGFITNGQSNSVTIFDLKTLAKIGEPAAGQNPDAVCYEPKTKRVFTFNGRSNDSTAINAKTSEVVATLPARRQAGVLPGGRRRQTL